MVLCLGPKSAGKTLLLRRLRQSDMHYDPYDEIFSTVPTVGVNIALLQTSKNKFVQISELGGSMAAIWHMHYEGALGILFVIDVKNMQQVSCAAILLLEVLKHEQLQTAKFAIVLNKTDVNSSVQMSEMKYLLRLDDTRLHAKQDIEIFETSCLTGNGIKELKQWVLQVGS